MKPTNSKPKTITVPYEQYNFTEEDKAAIIFVGSQILNSKEYKPELDELPKPKDGVTAFVLKYYETINRVYADIQDRETGLDGRDAADFLYLTVLRANSDEATQSKIDEGMSYMTKLDDMFHRQSLPLFDRAEMPEDDDDYEDGGMLERVDDFDY